MKTYQPAARNDTMLGVCQSLGEDFGIHPNILRVLFGVGLIVVPVAVIAAYVVLAVVVALNHWMFPKPWPAELVDEVASTRDTPDAHQAAAIEDERLAA